MNTSKRRPIRDNSIGKTRSLFSVLELVEVFSAWAFSICSFSFFLFFLEGRSFIVSSLLSAFTASFAGTTLAELVSPALMAKTFQVAEY